MNQETKEELMKKKRLEFLAEANVPETNKVYAPIELGVIPYAKNLSTSDFPVVLFIENIETFDAVGSLPPHFMFKQKDLNAITTKIAELESDGYAKVIYIYENSINLMGDIISIRYYVMQNINDVYGDYGQVAFGSTSSGGIIVSGYGENLSDEMFSESGSAAFKFMNGYLVKIQ